MLGLCKGSVGSHSDCSPTVVCVSHHIIPLAPEVVQCFAAGLLGGLVNVQSAVQWVLAGLWQSILVRKVAV
jgi:hypothetical protein